MRSAKWKNCLACLGGHNVDSDIGRGSGEAGLFRRDARPYGMVVRRLHLRQHQDHACRRLSLRQGRADQASARLRHQDRHAARLDGRDRPLRICRHGRAGQHAGLRHQQAADRAEADRAHAGRHPAHLPLARQDDHRQQADRGTALARGRRIGLEAEQRDGDAANEPGKFTAFCSYEWTSTPNNRNMHRNVFFKDCAKVPEMPYSSIDSSNPSDLWDWMDGQRKAGNELLAISHNANLSDGHMFPTDVDEKGRPIDAAWAASRDRNEHLTEIKQIKGALGDAPDAFTERRVRQFRDPDLSARRPGGALPADSWQLHPPGPQGRPLDAWRPAATTRTRPASSADRIRTTTGAPYRQDNFFGGHARNDGDIKQRMSGMSLPASMSGSRTRPA